MIKFTAELEDVCFTAELDNKDGWIVKLFESEQAKRDFKREGDNALTAEIVLDDEEMGALLYLAANGDNGEATEDMYAVIEPKLVNVPNQLRPIP